MKKSRTLIENQRKCWFKIILRVFGCMLAYDTYVSEQLKKMNISSKLNSQNNFIKSIKEICKFFYEEIKNSKYKEYSYMKKVDMSLFIIGLEDDSNKD